jgi:hypothetical protein
MKTYIWIAVAVVILLVYGLLDPNRFPFPQCPFLTMTGWKCPGCGSQRALHEFLHGHFLSAFKLNLLFIPALGYVLFGYATMAFFPAHWTGIKADWYSRRAALVLLVIIIFYWIARNL